MERKNRQNTNHVSNMSDLQINSKSELTNHKG